MNKYRHVNHNGTCYFSIGVLPDGTLHNPNGYPESELPAAVAAVDARRHARRSNAANFIVGGWRELGGGTPSENAPKQIGPQNPIKEIGQSVDEPSTAEILNDDLPDFLKEPGSTREEPATSGLFHHLHI